MTNEQTPMQAMVGRETVVDLEQSPLFWKRDRNRLKTVPGAHVHAWAMATRLPLSFQATRYHSL
jgi:hypothetical protein